MDAIFSATTITDKIRDLCNQYQIDYEKNNLATIKKKLFGIMSKIHRVYDEVPAPHKKTRIEEPSLNAQQQLFVSSILQELEASNDSLVFLLDAPPGTGKTFTLKHLLCRTKISYSIIVYSNSLVNDFAKDGLAAKTCFRFLNDIFSYSKSENMFEEHKNHFGDLDTLFETFSKIFESSLNVQLIAIKLFIIDEYTTVSPWLLVLLVLTCYRNKCHLLIVGDGDQLTSLQKSRYQKSTNRGLVLKFVDKSYTLQEQMRVTCPRYGEFLQKFKIMLDKNLGGEKPLTYDIIQFIFDNYWEKFFSTDISARYLAQRHQYCKQRQIDVIAAWAKNDEIANSVYPMKFNEKNELVEISLQPPTFNWKIIFV